MHKCFSQAEEKMQNISRMEKKYKSLSISIEHMSILREARNDTIASLLIATCGILWKQEVINTTGSLRSNGWSKSTFSVN